MSDFRKQIRDHYDARSLTPETVEAILAKGRAVEAGEASPKIAPLRPGGNLRRMLALAASIALLAVVTGFWVHSRTRADYASARRVIVEFFSKEHTYSTVSADPVVLRAWAIEHGAPPGFRIPAKLQGLPGKACTLLSADGKPVFLLCFMTVAENGKQDGGMVHLLVARSGDFRNLPRPGTRSSAADGSWNFSSWVEGGIVYTVAAPAPPEKVRSYVFVSYPLAQMDG